MNDPIERYYDQFETRYESAMRRSGGSKRRPVVRFAIAGAVTALAVGVGITVIPSDGKVDVIEEAQAALAVGDKIEHYKVTTRSYSWAGTPKNVEREEFWRRNRPYAVRVLRLGRDASDQSADAAENKSFFYLSGAKTAFWYTGAFSGIPNQVDWIRDGLKRGILRPGGTAVLDGRKVLRLVGEYRNTFRAGNEGSTKSHKVTQTSWYRFDLDPDTYAPLRLWTKLRSESSDRGDNYRDISIQRFALYEQLQPTANNLKQLRVQLPPGTRVVHDRRSDAGN